MNIKGIVGAAVVAVLLLVYSAAFIVDETEQAVITQFGRLVGDPIVEPGLNFKVPFVQIVTFFPKNLQAWDGDPGQIPTLDKTYIYVDAFARWRIVDPVKFFQSIGSFTLAKGRLDEIIDPAIRNLVTSNALVESVRWTNREMDPWVELDAFGEVETIEEERQEQGAFSRTEGRTREIRVGREKISELILAQAQPRLDVFGIELVDVKIKRINYVEQVREAVYQRMIAERRQIAEKYRSEGVGEARKIRGDKERDLLQIESEAYRTAQKIRGEADARVVRILADAYGVDPEFYTYQKTLETYREALEGSSVVFSTDSDFMRFLNRQGPDRR
ncbi:membrane protease subunit HflC [Desulfobotulus alkaliphilus]|uniref:Protein HflC n=1 Tax=Desulfobotulus alkaliphilus TaxID=622671 RepID=A0A562RRQ8_9BACT|nr:protease modulator HflC [Desulfobotulus alkaliphilus]TWI71791.1 membrane protease subunit HflC [Desulfobotulus alkaliphilus]